jgi:hypothetical protein
MKQADLDRDTDLSRGFSAGNYCNAYETQDFASAIVKREVKDKSSAFAIAFTMGFFGSYELHEIPDDHREMFIDAYKSSLGQRVLELGYCDPREELSNGS